MNKPSHELNRDHKRALASARRAISKAIERIMSVYNETPGYNRERDKLLEDASQYLLNAGNLAGDYAQTRFNITAETLDRY